MHIRPKVWPTPPAAAEAIESAPAFFAGRSTLSFPSTNPVLGLKPLRASAT